MPPTSPALGAPVLPPDPPPSPLPPAGAEDGRARTRAEELVREAARTGEVAELADLPEHERVLDAALLVELLTCEAKNPSGRPLVHPRGVRVSGGGPPDDGGPGWLGRLEGVLIVGALDLAHRVARVPLQLAGCVLDERPQLTAATLPALTLLDCDLPGLDGDRLTVTYDLRLLRCAVAGPMSLSHAALGSLDCQGTALVGGGGAALFADGAEITGGVFLRALEAPEGGAPVRTQVTGEVRLPAARIGGDLDLRGTALVGGAGQRCSRTARRSPVLCFCARSRCPAGRRCVPR